MCFDEIKETLVLIPLYVHVPIRTALAENNFAWIPPDKVISGNYTPVRAPADIGDLRII